MPSPCAYDSAALSHSIAFIAGQTVLRQYVAQRTFFLAHANSVLLSSARSGRREFIRDVFVARIKRRFNRISRWAPEFEMRQFVTIDSTDDPVEFLPN